MGFDWAGLAGAAIDAWQKSSASKKAGKDATKSANAANQTEWNIYQDQVRRQQPFYDNGLAAQNRYMQLLGLTPASGGGSSSSLYYDVGADGTPIARADLYGSDPKYRAAWDQFLKQHQNQWRTGYWSGSDKNMIQGQMESALGKIQQPASSSMTQQQAFDAFRNAPGYQFGLDQGMKAVQASAAARGGLNSGATLKALQRYGNDYADQQGFAPYMNRLSALYGGAQTAASNIGQAGQNYASAFGQNMNNASQARQQSTYNSANAWSQGLSDMGYLVNKYGTSKGWWGG